LKMQRGFTPMLLLTRNGQPVPGSQGDPQHVVRNSVNLLYFIAVLNIALGIAAFAFPGGMLAALGAGGWAAADGAIFGVLGFFTSRGSRVALSLAIALYVLESFFIVAGTGAETGRPNVGGLIVRFFFALLLVRGWKAMGQLRKAEPAAAN